MKIMLDAGHGYSTAGKRSPDGMKEYEFNRAVADYATKLLNQYDEVTVYSAHSDSSDIPVQERSLKANQLKVDCYVSIHANAAGNGINWHEAEGIETYVYKSMPSEAVSLANRIQTRIVSLTGSYDRGVKTANFHVLRETNMTAVLVECGFMTSKKDIKLLRSEYYRKKCAQAIVDALAAHYSLKKKLHQKVKFTKTESPASTYKVQIGSFSDKKNAESLALQLGKLGFKSVITRE